MPLPANESCVHLKSLPDFDNKSSKEPLTNHRRHFFIPLQTDVPQQLDIFGTVFDCADLVTFDNKGNYVSAIKAIAATQTMMHTSDIESLGNLFEGTEETSVGLLRKPQQPHH